MSSGLLSSATTRLLAAGLALCLGTRLIIHHPSRFHAVSVHPPSRHFSPGTIFALPSRHVYVLLVSALLQGATKLSFAGLVQDQPKGSSTRHTLTFNPLHHSRIPAPIPTLSSFHAVNLPPSFSLFRHSNSHTLKPQILQTLTHIDPVPFPLCPQPSQGLKVVHQPFDWSHTPDHRLRSAPSEPYHPRPTSSVAVNLPLSGLTLCSLLFLFPLPFAIISFIGTLPANILFHSLLLSVVYHSGSPR